MKSIVFCGVRGGTGTTSTMAAVSLALHALDEKVLMIDLAPSNLLSLHFGGSPSATQGWARALVDGRPWQEAAAELQPGLHMLPFGLLSPAERLRAPQLPRLLWQSGNSPLASMQAEYSVVLFDLPSSEMANSSVMLRSDLQIVTTEADPASCALLAQLPPDKRRHYLITRYDPISRVQRDIRLLWQSRLGASLLPQVMHRDASMVEALCSKAPVGRYRPESLAAQDAQHIAAWCQGRLRALE